MYNDVNKPEKIKGVKTWKNPKNQFNVIMIHYSADPDKDPDRDGKEWYENERKGTTKAAWNKEYEIDFTTKSGKLVYGPQFCDYDKNIHCINSFEFQDPVEYILALDFGQRNPTCALLGIWTRDNRLYIVDEYYKPALPSVSSREMFKQFKKYMIADTDGKSMEEKRRIADASFQIKVIDPTTQSKNRSKHVGGEEIEYSVIEEFYDNGWDFTPATNNVSAGITRVREYMKINEADGKPNLYIFQDKCPNLVWELSKYKYKENTEQQAKTSNDSESVVKKDDHATDCMRYLVATRPYNTTLRERDKNRIEKDIEKLIKPSNIPSVWDFDN